jgi:hypothetical protein
MPLDTVLDDYNLESGAAPILNVQPRNNIPNVYTASLEKRNEQTAMEAFENFINGSVVAQGLNESGKINLYLEHLRIQKTKN